MHQNLYNHFQKPCTVWLARLLYISLSILLLVLAACGGPSGAPKRAGTSTAPRPAPTRTAVSTIFNQPITYVALGASDAVGVGSNMPGAQGYVPLIAEHLPKGSHSLNLGVSGIHLHEALHEELPLALNTSPQLITIWLVANDFVGGVTYQSYINDLRNLLAQLNTQTHALIVMANLPDLTLLPAFNHDSPDQRAAMQQSIKQWNQGIAQVATHDGVALVNLFQDGSEITSHPGYISGDGFHPSTRGYMRLAQLFWQVIQTDH